MISNFLSIQNQRVTERRTDRQICRVEVMIEIFNLESHRLFKMKRFKIPYVYLIAEYLPI